MMTVRELAAQLIAIHKMAASLTTQAELLIRELEDLEDQEAEGASDDEEAEQQCSHPERYRRYFSAMGGRSGFICLRCNASVYLARSGNGGNRTYE